MGNVRIYTLAKELKLDNKRVIEDARRLGVDVSQPSNTLTPDIADKIREKYFPKKAVPASKIKLVKAVKKAPEPEPQPQDLSTGPQAEAPSAAEAEPAVEVEAAEAEADIVKRPKVIKLEPPPPPPAQTVVRLTPQAAAPAPAEETKPAAPRPVERPSPRRPQVTVLKPSTAPTPSALAAAPLDLGIAPPHRKTYIPPKDTRRRGRRTVTRSGPSGPGGRRARTSDAEFAADAPSHYPSQPVRRVFTEFKALKLTEGTTIKEFSEKVEAKPKDVVSVLMKRGVLATINQTIDQDVARDVGKEFGFDVEFVPFEEAVLETEVGQLSDEDSELNERAPVVTVMGHVDHGKTSLLDAIRETRVAEGEAGGITQHIGAYSVQVPDPDDRSKMRQIVFLDTPGHEAFTMMRARGAKVTDLVVLVVAADDGVMPQTIEAIEHSKAAGVPIVVAINKIDKPNANIDRVKQALSEKGLVWDGWGGDTVMVEVSAKKRLNIDGLLEMILLTSDVAELKANAKRLASGTVLEAKLDKGRGAVATILVQNGTLKVGDPFIVGSIFGRVRAMFDDRGKSIIAAPPATPVEVLGFQSVPEAGDHFQVVLDVAKAQEISSHRQSVQRMLRLRKSAAGTFADIVDRMKAGELRELRIVLKADVQGSLEVVRETLNKLSTEKVKINIIRSGVGAITESDVMLAAASVDSAHSAVIIGFNVRPEPRAVEIADKEKVEMRLHSIIYKLEEEIRDAMIGLMAKTKQETILGRAEIRTPIRVPRVGMVAGSFVLDGAIRRNAEVRVIRDNVVVQESRIASLRRFKDDVSEVGKGFECGIVLEKFQDVKPGDVLEAFITEEIAPTRLS